MSEAPLRGRLRRALTRRPLARILAPARTTDRTSNCLGQWTRSPAEGLHRGRAGAGPLRHGAAGRAPGGVPGCVRAPEPARAAALRPAPGGGLPRLAAAVG